MKTGSIPASRKGIFAGVFMEAALPLVDDSGATTSFTLCKHEDALRIQKLSKLQFAFKPLPTSTLLPSSSGSAKKKKPRQSKAAKKGTSASSIDQQNPDESEQTVKDPDVQAPLSLFECLSAIIQEGMWQLVVTGYNIDSDLELMGF